MKTLIVRQLRTIRTFLILSLLTYPACEMLGWVYLDQGGGAVWGTVLLSVSWPPLLIASIFIENKG